MTPRLAALSSAEISARFSAAFPPLAVFRLASERRLVMTLRLRSVRRGFCRARLEADLELAMSQDLWTGRLADTLRNVKPAGPTPTGSPGLGSKSTLSTMELFWWSVTLLLMAIGLVGTVLPIFPGPAVIFAAAILHRSILGTEKSIGWPSI